MHLAEPHGAAYTIQIVDAALKVLAFDPSVNKIVAHLYPVEAGWWQRPVRTRWFLAIRRLSPSGTTIEGYRAQLCSGSESSNFLVTGNTALASKLEALTSEFAIRELSHRHFLLHGATLAAGGAALLLLGPSGAGKSTLTTALALRGFRYLSDEIAVIDSASLRVWPFPKSISLRRTGQQVLDEQYPGWQGTLGTDTLILSESGVLLNPRPWLPPAPGAGFEPAWIVFTQYEQCREYSEVTPLSRGDALCRLLRQRLTTHRWEGFAAFTSAMTELVKQVPCYALRVGTLRSAVACIDRLLAGELPRPTPAQADLLAAQPIQGGR